MSQWLNEQDDAKAQKEICERLAICLEAVLEDAGYHVPTKVLEACEKVLYEWNHK